jgi:hypothetical protein
MSQEPQDPHGNNQTVKEPTEKKGLASLSVHHIVTLVVLFIVIVYNLGELLKTQGVAEVAANQSMFSIPTEISDRYNSCDYKNLFFCEPKSTDVPGCENLVGVDRATCILTDNGLAGTSADQPSRWASVPYVNVVLAAVEILPHLPDAVIHMLRERWDRGSLEFSLGLVFVFAYITLMVVALRQESPLNLWLFALAVVFGPYLMLGVFWLFQKALAGAAAKTTKVASMMVSTIGLPGCLAVCIRHDFKSAVKVVGEIRRGVSS